MLIAHISDFHVFADAPETSLVRADAEQAARKVVADIASYKPAFDAVMFTGDLADGGSEENYALLAEILRPLDMPVFVVPGNHDNRAGLRAAFENVLPFGQSPYLNYEARLGDLHILALDTLVEGQIHGALDRSQLDWLAGRLESRPDERTLILMHHPPFPSGNAPLDAMALRDGREEFGRLVWGYDQPLYILAGHIHRPFQAVWNGAFCQVAGSPAFQHALDLRPDAPEPGAVGEPYTYFILRLDAQQTVTIHKRYVSL